MACPQVLYRGDGLQMWRVAVNVLNKQSQTANKGCHSSLGVGEWLTTAAHKKFDMFRINYKHLGNGQILCHALSTRKLM
jgi:hypothetical protein